MSLVSSRKLTFDPLLRTEANRTSAFVTLGATCSLPGDARAVVHLC